MRALWWHCRDLHEVDVGACRDQPDAVAVDPSPDRDDHHGDPALLSVGDHLPFPTRVLLQVRLRFDARC